MKQAAAHANQDLGLLDEQRTAAIIQACREIRAGELRDEFVVDVIQGGAGTSTNMNANEVIANRGARAARAREGRVRASASDGPRQSQPEHQRRLSHRDQRGAALRLRALLLAMAGLREAFAVQGARSSPT